MHITALWRALLSNPSMQNDFHPDSNESMIFMGNDDVMTWKRFPPYWPFVKRNQWSPVDSLQKGSVVSGYDVLFANSTNKLLSLSKVDCDLRSHDAH